MNLNTSMERKELAAKYMVETNASFPAAAPPHLNVKPKFNNLYKQFRYGGANEASTIAKTDVNDKPINIAI